MSVLTLLAPGELPAPMHRPWLDLYNIRLKPPPRASIVIDEADLAPIQRLFPEELMAAIFSRLGPYTLGKAACVCKQWRHLADHPRHWQAACEQSFGRFHKDASPCPQLLRQCFRGSWRRMFLEVPRVRYDGLYVSRNTYIRQGAAEWRREHSTFLVTYFRYFRFFPDGTLLYRTSPLTVARVARSLAARPRAGGGAGAGGGGARGAGAPGGAEHVFSGRYVIKGGKAFVAVTYPNSRNTEVRARCALRGVPAPGAANRLDLEDLASFDRDHGTTTTLAPAGPDPDEDPAGAGSVTSYRRGLASCVFVPWEGVASSPLNLPTKDMDFWVPG